MLSVLILSGGQSSRMGTDKALLKIGERILIEKIASISMALSQQVYVLSFWPERYKSILPSGCHLIQEIKATEQIGSHGPLVAFAQALPHIQSEWVLLLACDLPRLKLEILKEGYLSLPKEAIAYIPRQNSRWEPLCAFYNKSCYGSILDYLQTGRRSFQGWLNTIPASQWNTRDTSILFNCNSPEDLYLFL